MKSTTAFTFVFTAGSAGLLLIVFGLIGYMPPAHMSLDADTWRRGTWTDGVIPAEIVLGSVLVVAAGLVGFRINRRLDTYARRSASR